jgi:sec-independent protein translocase protein TatA
MDFLGIGPGEIIVIIVLALIILGPGKLTETARTLGKTLRAIKKASAEFTTAVTRELDEVKESLPSEPRKDSPVGTGTVPQTSGVEKPQSQDNPAEKTDGGDGNK